MSPRDAALAAMTSVIWGLGFVAAKLGLESFSAPQLTALRFLLASLFVFVVPAPRIGWWALVLIGLTLFTGQFLLLFLSLTLGMPPGLASITQQTQAFFTVLLAALFLGDVPTRKQSAGMTIAFGGLGLIAVTTGPDLDLATLALALGGALSWAIGNVLVKCSQRASIFSLVVWASLVPPLPALILSALDGRSASLASALGHASWWSLGAVVYLGLVATVIAYATWGDLLRRYPAGAVAPFALLAPCVGVVASAAVFGEVFSPTRSAGMALILAGLAVVVGPGANPSRRPESSGTRRAASDRS